MTTTQHSAGLELLAADARTGAPAPDVLELPWTRVLGYSLAVAIE